MKENSMKSTFNTRIRALSSAIAAMLISGAFSGCGTVQAQAEKLDQKAIKKIEEHQAKANQPIPVITSTSAAWLLGQPVEVAPVQAPILGQSVAYNPVRRVSLQEVTTWVSQATGIKVEALDDTDNKTPPAQFALNYNGTLDGMLDAAATASGRWWKFENGRVTFYRTLTRTFYLPASARVSGGSSSISATSGAGGSGGSSAGGGEQSSQGGQGGQASGGQSSGDQGASGGGSSSTSSYSVDVWGSLEKTAKAVSNGGAVITNASLGSITVTGTPTQVRNVEEWAKGLADNLSQQVEITVQIFKVKSNQEENYNWNPNVAFKGLTTKYGFSLKGPQTPAILSGNTPMNLTANVLETATGSQGQYSGSELALQALSSLGRVNETMRHTTLTTNGQPAPMQIANQLSYLKSTTMGAPTTAGTTPLPPTLTPGLVTTGFTAMFIPRIVDGKIHLSMNLTSSNLVKMGVASSGGSSIQTPNIDVSTFQQNVVLTPGDSVLLTGIEQDGGKVDQNGVGMPNNYAFGGGMGSNTSKQLFAIVISVKVL